MPGVPAVLLEEVVEEPAQAGVAPVGPRDMNELVEPAVDQGLVELHSGRFDGPVTGARTSCSGVSSAAGGELPILVGHSQSAVFQGAAERLAVQLGAEGVVLPDRSEMLPAAPPP